MKQKANKDRQSKSDRELLKNVDGLCEFELQFLKKFFTNFSTITKQEAIKVMFSIENPTRIRQALIQCIISKL